MGRIDDVINVAGHRLSTIEVESRAGQPSAGRRSRRRWPAATSSRARPSPCSSRSKRATPATTLRDELKKHVRKEIGALAVPDDIRFTDALPKTRSGKIMRRLLRDIAAGKETVRRHDDAGRLQRAGEIEEEEE